MSKTVIISTYNPFPFVRMDLIVPDNLAYMPFGKADFKDTIKPHQPRTCWYQKWLWDKIVTIHIQRTHVGDGNFTAITPIDENGVELVTIVPTDYLTLPGNVISDTGEQLHTVQFRFSLDAYSELDGLNFFRLKLVIGFGDDTRIDYISPILDIAEVHEGVSWLQYSNATNDKYVLFEQLRPSFGVLVDSYGMTYWPGGEYDTLDDQNGELKVLYHQSYNTHKWDIGGDTGVPQLMLPIIDTATRATDVTIDNMQVTREDNANIERVGQETSLLQFATLMLREANNGDSYTDSQKEVLVFSIPSFPAAKREHYMQNGGDVWGWNPDVAIYDEANLDSYISYLNATIVTGYNKSGVFQKVVEGGNYNVYYINGEGENYIANGGAVLTQRHQVIVNVTNAAVPFTYKFQQLGIHVTDYGDNSNICVPYLSNLSGTQAATHTFGSTGSKTINIFTDGFMTVFRIENQTNKVTNHGGVYPPLQVLWMVDQSFGGLAELDLAPLSGCRNSLQTLNLGNSGIVKIKEGWSNYAQKAFGACKTWVLTGNAMSVTNTTKFMKEFLALDTYKGVAYTATGVIFIKQSPVAVIVDAGTLAAIDTLTDPINTGGYGWAVVKD